MGSACVRIPHLTRQTRYQTWRRFQRRDAENAEESAERTKNARTAAHRARLGTPSVDVFGFLCACLCVLCIAILKNFVILHKFHAALDSSATVACCAADMAVIATRPRSVRR